ncbi:MAG: hypothetical protein GQ564_10090 [Bacteroidales bacterium]|nr:hypothetical protein [Bacteroidales bacterium]
MRRIFLFIYFIFQVLLSSVNAQSNYPVFVTPTLSPPYSLNLSDYSKFGSQKLMITIHINDLNISNLPIKLRIKLETTGVTIENPATIATTPIYIDGGSTSILFGNDLTDYFNINNLIFKGYSKEAYNRTGQLPEGFYRFSVEVLHFNTNRVISNLGTATAWIALGKPPVLKLPENNAQMGQFKGMPLTFSWLSSNVGSPVSANTIQYKFEMWEMHVPGINPNVVAASMPIFHEHTDFNKLYSLYPTNLLMKAGMQYAWRVTASDLSGFVPFEQNGHSEIRTFIYKAACDSITDLTSSHRGKNGLFSWNPEDNHTSFNVEMRNPKTNWMANSESYENKAEFFDLDYGATYEMRVQAVCDGDPDSKSDFSEWKTLSIPTPEPPDTADCPDCVCDDDIPDVELQNFDIRNDLQPGDTIINKTGTSRFILKTVEDQGNGVYKGIFLFWAEIWKLKFICNYWDLQVNTDDVIVNMDFESVYNPQFLVDVDATIDYLDSLAGVITTLTTDIQIDDTLTIDETITTIYVNEGDSVIAVVVDENGNTSEIVISDDVDDIEETLIEGEDGEEYVVTSDGEVMGLDEYNNTGGGNDGAVDDYNEEKEENNLSENITVNFNANEIQKYGFDQYNEEKIGLQSKYPSFNNGYKPAYKSIASFSTDIVGVSNSGNNIIFKDEMGIPAIKTGEDITLRGSSNGSDVALYAYQVINDTIEKIAGKLNVLSFDEQAKQLYIVSVNGAATPDETSLQEVLNTVYSQAVTSWQVTKLGNLSDIVFEETNMTHGGTSAISVYNKDQRTIVNTFEDKVSKLENNAYYLFFVENVTFKENSIAGYMPLQRQIGFIYDNPNDNIIAHELGHGAFNLWHTFSPDNFIATEHTTQNLMDYKGGTDLWKHQWELVQSPDKMLFGWLQDESEGEYIHEVLGKKYEVLFNKVYSKNYTLNTEYYDKIQEGETSNFAPEFDDSDLAELTDEEKEWVKKWEIRARKSSDVLLDIIEAIQDAPAGAKISKINAQQNKVYIVKCTFNDYDFNVAIYGQGESTTLNKIFTKVAVSRIDDLSIAENLKHLYVDVNEGRNYWILSLYENGKSKPSLIIQISGRYDVLAAEKWLKFLGILIEIDESLTYDYFVTDNDAWFRQKESPYKAIKPTEESNSLAKGTQVSILDKVKDDKNNDVAKIKIKTTQRIEYTSLNNLTQVKTLKKELNWKLIEDYQAIPLPYSEKQTKETYKKSSEFIGYKSCGNFIKVKGVVEDEIEGHWIDKSKAVVTNCTSGFCCQNCGRDLTVTLTRLQEIFPNNKNLTQSHVDLFNKALKLGGFNTCKMHVHFFSQVYIESVGFTKYIEGAGYSFDGALDWHSTKVDVQNVLMKQSFFDDNNHLDYFYTRVLKNDKKNGDQIGLNYKTYTKGENTIKIPTGNPNCRKVKDDEKGIYTKYSVPKDERENVSAKFFNVIYSETNGNKGLSSKDGSKYRGRGAIQLTGRSIYKGTSEQANLIFKGESFDWEKNYNDVSSKEKDIIYSAVAYFHFRYNKIMKYQEGVGKINSQTCPQVTYDVNGGSHGLDKRQIQYNRISLDIYKINLCNE